MKAIVAQHLGDLSGLAYTDVEDPHGDDLVVVDVGAAGVCFPDFLLITGQYQWKPDTPFIPGNEVAGTVRYAPAGSGFVVGQPVSACPTLGGYAECVAVPPEYVVATPDGLDDTHAACLLGNYYTAYYALDRRGAVTPGQTVLVLGSAGGIGTAAIQIAKARGAHVIALVHRHAAVEFVESLGADVVLPLAPGWPKRVADATGARGVDLVVDQVGGQVFDLALDVMAPGGSLLVLGFASGGGIPTTTLGRLVDANVSVVGVNSADFVGRVPGARAMLQAGLAELIDAGLRPPSPVSYPLSDARAALEALARGEVIGKAVLLP